MVDEDASIALMNHDQMIEKMEAKFRTYKALTRAWRPWTPVFLSVLPASKYKMQTLQKHYFSCTNADDIRLWQWEYVASQQNTTKEG